MANKFLSLDGLKYFINKIIGKNDISGIGDGTLTGAVSTLNTNLLKIKTVISSVQVNTSNGNTIGYVGSGTLSDLPNNTIAVIPKVCSRTDSYQIIGIVNMDSNTTYTVNAKVTGWFNTSFYVLYTE